MLREIDFDNVPSLHLGPMSGNVITAVAEFAKKRAWPICLIASRRQIDCKKHGGGYVDNLSTEAFAEKLKPYTDAGHIILARDHGGPYQRAEEEKLSASEAMDAAEETFRVDIESGFNIIHLDPEKCIQPGDPNGLKQFTDLTIDLLARCLNLLKEMDHKNVRFEVGSDEGIGMDFAPGQWSTFLNDINKYCDQVGLPAPLAIAVPLGTKVKETDNVGGLANDTQDPIWTKRVNEMQAVAQQYNVKLKLHNADYIPLNALKRYIELGVEQINVAPELGVIETLALLKFLRENDMQSKAQALLDIAYNSRKWERWLKENSTATDEEKAIIAGHYIFATDAFRTLKQDILSHSKAADLDSYLIDAITQGILYYYNVLEEAYDHRKHASA